MADDEQAKPDNRDSGMHLEFTLTIGYRRRRPDTQGDVIEARIDSLVLLAVGSTIALAIIVILLPRLLDWVGRLGN